MPAFNNVMQIIELNKIQHIICLGVGDPCTNSAARIQASFIYQIFIQASISTISYYDPILCDHCQEILSSLGFNVLKTDQYESLFLEFNCLFFIPHCPRFIYHNLLLQNWNKTQIEKLFVIGNSFYNYLEKYDLKIQKAKTFVEEVASYKVHDETLLDFGNYDCFSLLYWISFNHNQINDLPNEKFQADYTFLRSELQTNE